MTSQVWVLTQQRDGHLHRGSLEAIAFAQRLAADLETTVEAVILGQEIGHAASELSQLQLDKVHVADHPSLLTYTPAAYVDVLAPLLEQARPAWVLLPHTYQSVDFMARLGQRLAWNLLPEAIGYRHDEGGLVWKRPILQGKLHADVRVKRAGCTLVSLQSGAISVDDLVRGSTTAVPVALASEPRLDRSIEGVEAVGDDKVDLSAAEIVVAVGRGLGDADKLEPIKQLAAALGAEIGASRPVIDSGWLPRELQIGSSGQTVAPKLYFAIGISGAIQHLVGMKGAGCVVAINKDAGAPIFNVAQYGIVGDLHEIVPALTNAIREAKT